MQDPELISKISQNIKKSKKYKSVYDKTINRIVRGFALKYKNKPKEIEKKSKNLLHQIWGAFYSKKPDFKKLLDNLENDIKASKSIEESILPILHMQSSVKERIYILDNFYKKIFEITGTPNSIIDYACGLNPLTLFWMDLQKLAQYKAFDIDEDEVNFLNVAYKLSGVKNAKVYLGDILADDFQYADVVFLLKLLPCLEHQKKDSGIEVIKNLKCKYAVVSFPVKSLSGQKAGMADFYSNNFKKLVEKENWQIKEILFDTELVFVIKK